MGKKSSKSLEVTNSDPTSKRLRTGVEGLDQILEGGLPENRIYLFEGDPGTGKTTIALQFLMEGARRGEAGLYVTLSETKEELQVQSIAHGVVSLEHLAVEYGADRRRLRVLKLRGSRFSGGYHDFNIETGGVRVFPRLVAAHHRQAFTPEPVSSGLPELDSLL